MLTCVRNRHYDEALDLGAFVRKLETLHGGLPLVRRLAAEARAASAAMRGALLRRLEADVALPECLRAVGFLRRLACFGERELRLEFLVRREAWVATCAAQAEEEGGPAYESLRRATDGLRLHLHDRRAEAYVAHVRRQLPRLADGGALASVMEAAMYAGASLGRAGLDLRPLLAPAFEDAARGLLLAPLLAAALARTFASTAHALGLDPAALARTLREEDDGAGGGDGDGGRCAAVGAQTGGTAGGGVTRR
ncbi:Conserved oligomeric Golgi complex subunit 8 [Auxenochlorella protothecoides]|uniref:Conserved oligomeric Golgi complex subunit 8 n=1 Tax=Auxenochlorella protothecoides TaxID=3075 RepID=A0A087SKD6_AUXPR|nr:Conserved oligomeric Golgi complex subunit 8 [Auxenochlorella protothecoides]KFM26190.1 Conserved oligomeric Golgi complex subunit 8 [Auxenochlorella protothecoides]